jgi:hypothetical protein
MKSIKADDVVLVTALIQSVHDDGTLTVAVRGAFTNTHIIRVPITVLTPAVEPRSLDNNSPYTFRNRPDTDVVRGVIGTDSDGHKVFEVFVDGKTRFWARTECGRVYPYGIDDDSDIINTNGKYWSTDVYVIQQGKDLIITSETPDVCTIYARGKLTYTESGRFAVEERNIYGGALPSKWGIY